MTTAAFVIDGNLFSRDGRRWGGGEHTRLFVQKHGFGDITLVLFWLFSILLHG